MQIEIITKPVFSVIGIPGSTEEGEGFVRRCWAEANARFPEVAALAKKDADGSLAGCWGAMSDFSLTFAPWEEDFTKGLYLAGVECEDDAEPPEGWTKWTLPGFRFVRIPVEGGNTFREGLRYLEEQGLALAGAVQDFTDVKSGKDYMCFPIERL